MEKTRGQKSRATVPLSNKSCNFPYPLCLDFANKYGLWNLREILTILNVKQNVVSHLSVRKPLLIWSLTSSFLHMVCQALVHPGAELTPANEGSTIFRLSKV
jgi:hypothetical protein